MVWWVLAGVIYVLGMGVAWEIASKETDDELELAVWSLFWPLWLAVAVLLAVATPFVQLLAWPGRKLVQILEKENEV